MQGRRQHTVAHGLDHLDHPGHTGGGLRMTHVGLDGTQPQRPIRIAFLAVGRQDRLGLNGIASPGTGGMGLHHIHIRPAQSRCGQRQTDHLLLGGLAGSDKPVAGPVLVDRAAADHRQHLMAVAASFGKALKQHHPRALGEAGPIRGSRE
uniref:Uncharacterized protein n=1 Tax=Mycobacterium riyadhense TaxID=486698 RepID=A0A653EPL2_9MYCO|nr:hypothetical protein BIN_B_03010 [Mycobacterium riyadhense]